VNKAYETEALKHSFLLRGFFRKRGYYSLTSLSPDLYRTDRLFVAQGNDRPGCAQTNCSISIHKA
jgi:phospholipid/cholesterol/gamma-HCH transport system substrate-binding protein